MAGPEDRADLRMGILASTVANVQRDPTKKPEPFAATDFMPRFDDPDDGQTSALSPEQWSALMHARYGSAESPDE